MNLVDEIFQSCINIYENIPKTGKPVNNEWTVMAAVVGLFNEKIEVLSLGTGSKCIGKKSMSPKGDVLNDSHAEVIARRGFLKYLYLEISKLIQGNNSEFFCNENGAVRVKNGIKFCFVVSSMPCGDSSIMKKNEVSDCEIDVGTEIPQNLKRKNSEEENPAKKFKTENDIHRTGAKCLSSSEIQDPHLPGINYHITGAVRTKPGRGDPTASVSCSDKLARWNAVGIQGALLSFFIPEPIFMDFVIIGGDCPFSKESFDRAINERIKKQQPIPVYQSAISFPHKKGSERINPSSASILYCKNDNKIEVSVNGYKQGATKKNLGKKSSRISVCKKDLFMLFCETVELFNGREKIFRELNIPNVNVLKNLTYEQVKNCAKNYQENWESVKTNCFQVWTVKPNNLLEFVAVD